MILKIDAADNVGVSVSNLVSGISCAVKGTDNNEQIRVINDVPKGHKVALFDIPEGSEIIKYGCRIGSAVSYISAGSHVHTHNMISELTGKTEYSRIRTRPSENIENNNKDLNEISEEVYINGYRRPNGKTGIRNEIWIIPTVGCINGTVRNLEKAANVKFGSIKGIDGVHSFEHPYGCSQLGDDLSNTREILKGLILHPNAGGVLVTGLGCENNRLDELRQSLGDYDSERILFMECQSVEDETETGLQLIGKLIETVCGDKRVPVPFSELTIGLKCGGSDAFSGITANPLLGVLTDRIVSLGAGVVMAEVPEMFGAEQLLMDRSYDETTFGSIVDMINFYKDYFLSHGENLYDNPSPGNREGGITTLEEKSLGCVKKSGAAPVVSVIKYGGQVVSRGLNLLYSPGNDLVSSTALASAGAQIICFTTGRGTPYGAPVPTVKISSNSELAEKKSSWIDFDAGNLVNDGDYSGSAKLLLNMLKDIASGTKITKNEIYDHRDIAIFKNGITL